MNDWTQLFPGYNRATDSGREVKNLFCGECGTRLFHERTYSSDTINVKAGTLDDTTKLRPVGNLWTRSAQTWVTISDQMLNYEGQPDAYHLLWDKWTQQGS
ncbi:GFA family protein [Calothrix sp. FACHB-156]|nr:GFA family protein [Calothrix sp. FACHB-156]